MRDYGIVMRMWYNCFDFNLLARVCIRISARYTKLYGPIFKVNDRMAKMSYIYNMYVYGMCMLPDACNILYYTSIYTSIYILLLAC